MQHHEHKALKIAFRDALPVLTGYLLPGAGTVFL